MLLFGCWTTVKEVDVNYTYYLGPDYKQKMKPIKKTSTIIANHISFLDGPCLIKAIFPAFAPSIEFASFPVVSTILNTMDSIYMPRGGTEEAKKQAIDAIRERQWLIEETGEFNPFLIFPEGTTSNGSQIMPFK